MRGPMIRLVSVGAVGLLVAACSGSDSADSTEAPATSAATTAAPATTIAATTTSEATTTTTATTTSSTSTTTTSSTTTTTEPPAPGPVEACFAYVGELAPVLQATSDQLDAGAATVGQLADGTLAAADGAEQLAAIADEFASISQQLIDLGEPPPSAVPAVALIGEALELFEAAADKQSQGAATGDPTLINDGTADLDAGADLLTQVPDVLPDCETAAAAPDGGTDGGSTELATPDETDLEVFFRFAESVFDATDSPYAGTPDAVLVESAQASCRVLLAGGTMREAIEAAIAASPAAGQPFGAPEQQFVLFIVPRGAALWCPSVITDEDAFTDEVISTIVDVFFEG